MDEYSQMAGPGPLRDFLAELLDLLYEVVHLVIADRRFVHPKIEDESIAVRIACSVSAVAHSAVVA